MLLCTQCRHQLPLTHHHLNPENETFQKFYGRLPIEHASSFLYFHKEGIVQELIHNLKYRGQENIGTLIGNWFSEDLQNIPELKTVDSVIPVPLHPKRLRERGYNQVALFGKTIASRLAVDYDNKVLQRRKYAKTQTFKNLIGRAEISGNTFEASYSDNDHGKHFLLVDDVITTGATLEACGKALLEIPGTRLSIVTIAFAHS